MILYAVSVHFNTLLNICSWPIKSICFQSLSVYGVIAPKNSTFHDIKNIGRAHCPGNPIVGTASVKWTKMLIEGESSAGKFSW